MGNRKQGNARREEKRLRPRNEEDHSPSRKGAAWAVPRRPSAPQRSDRGRPKRVPRRESAARPKIRVCQPDEPSPAREMERADSWMSGLSGHLRFPGTPDCILDVCSADTWKSSGQFAEYGAVPLIVCIGGSPVAAMLSRSRSVRASEDFLE